jgi:hypothetical protein
MNRQLVLGFLFAVFCMPAFAQSAKVEKEVLPPAKPGAPEIKVEKDKPLTPDQEAAMLCQATRIMGSTVGAEYQPGVDVHGKPVVPADANDASEAFTVPERVDIPLNIEVLKTIGAVSTPTPELTASFGTISVMKGGQVTYNGKDMTTSVNSYCNTHKAK